MRKIIILFNLIFFIIAVNTVSFANIIAFNGYDLSAYGAKLVQHKDGSVYIEVDSLPDLICEVKSDGTNVIYNTYKISNGNQYIGDEPLIDKSGVLNIWDIEWGGANNYTAFRTEGANDPNQYSKYTIDNSGKSGGPNSSQQDGWVQVGGNWKYSIDGDYVKGEEVEDVSGKYYYLDSQGNMVSNQWIDEYYYDNSGARRDNGWASKGSTWYYFENGEMLKDVEQEIVDANGVAKLYHFESDGKLRTSGVSDEGYQINGSGEIVIS